MKRLFLWLLCLLPALTSTAAQDFPTVSTSGENHWYIIKFMNGGKAITAESGALITTAAATGSDAQLWKIMGSASNGYTIINKKGYTLYVNSAAKNQMVYAASTADTGVTKFYINATSNSSYTGGWEIQPVGNTAVSMNLWGGTSGDGSVGLWTSSDQNNPMQFIDANEFEQMGKISVIPYPAELSVTNSESSFSLGTLTAIACNNEQMQEHIAEFVSQLATTAGITLGIKEAGDAAESGEIWFGTDETLPDEGYTLKVNDDNIEIKASKFAGWFYGLQTLKQLLPREYFAGQLQENTDWSIPFVDIKDQPTLGHRGYMLDISRHFFNKEEVKKVLDIMALYKMNRFHWHLTDDQGWRIEIPEYPKLTEVGAIRSKSFSNPGDGEAFYDDTEYGRGMYYTQEELKEVVNYALARGIEIMPEVDLPGHMVAAVTSYPEFSCDSTKEYSVRVASGISQDVLNIGDDRVIDFLKCVLDNLAAIFPHQYIHLGGDECPTGQWAVNELCLARVEELGLDGVEQLQSWLVEELGVYLKEKHGKDIVVWDELLSNWNDENQTKPVIMAWNSLGKSASAAERGMKSIIVPYQYLYLDFLQAYTADRFVDEPYNGGWGDGDGYVNTVDEIYNLNPLSSLSGKEEYALGVQGNMWTETANDIDEVEYQLLPRMLAISEIGWLPNASKDWSSFYKRLQSHDEIFEYLDYQYAKHFIEPTEYTDAENTKMEAESILTNSIRGGVGYPSAEIFDALQQAYSETEGDDVTELAAAIENYKNADIVQPEAGKTYQVVSASTYYKRQYAGSTMYQNNESARFHYTTQTEPEELWQFTPAQEGYVISNIASGDKLSMDTYDSAVTVNDGEGTPVRIDKATIATADYTYIPGVVTISEVEGYDAAVTGSVKRLSAECSGDVFAKDEAALCYNGTWKIVEITDFTAQLQGLVEKCEIIILTANPGEINEYTQEALDYLQSSVITPAKEAIEGGNISEEQYNAYVTLYHQFLMMEKTSIAQGLSEDCYYYIYNVYFGKYASYNSSGNKIAPVAKSSSDNLLWSIVKKSNGTIYIYNKASGTAAYISSNSAGQTVKLGKEYAWSLEEHTNDDVTGICIMDGSGSYSWYTNPSTWNYILTKPTTWGASTWKFIKTTIEVPTAIVEVETDKTADGIYDLLGNRLNSITTPGIYIVNGEKKIVK